MPVRQRSVAMVYQQFINYPNLTRLREHRLAAARRRREEGGPRPARARDGGADEADAAARPQAARAFRRPAAAHRAGARHRQAGRPRAPRRAARQPRLQAARGAARGAAAHLLRHRRDLRLRHHRAGRGAAARRLDRDAGAGPRHAVRPDRRGLPAAEQPGDGAHLLRSADQHARGQEERREHRAPPPGI